MMTMTVNRLIRSVLVAGAVIVAIGGAARTAHAGLITLSTHTTGEFQANHLHATLNFQIDAGTLLLTVTNDSAADQSLWINQVFFNTDQSVSDLQSLNVPAGWSLQRNRSAGGFGRFDYGLLTGGGGSGASNAIRPGESLTFLLNITGDGASDASFLSGFSTGNNPMIVAAKFIVGTDANQTGFGGTNAIPSPGAAMALIAWLLIVPRRRR